MLGGGGITLHKIATLMYFCSYTYFHYFVQYVEDAVVYFIFLFLSLESLTPD